MGLFDSKTVQREREQLAIERKALLAENHKAKADANWRYAQAEAKHKEAQVASAEAMRMRAEAKAELAKATKLKEESETTWAKVKKAKQDYIHPDELYEHLLSGLEFFSRMSGDMRQKMEVVTDVKAQQGVAGILDVKNEAMIRGEEQIAEWYLAWKDYYLALIGAQAWLANQERFYLAKQKHDGIRGNRLTAKYRKMYELDWAKVTTDLTHYDPLLVGAPPVEFMALKKHLALEPPDTRSRRRGGKASSKPAEGTTKTPGETGGPFQESMNAFVRSCTGTKRGPRARARSEEAEGKTELWSQNGFSTNGQVKP